MNGIITFLLLCALASGETINHGDNSEDYYISYANIAVQSTSTDAIPLYDTHINFDPVSLA